MKSPDQAEQHVTIVLNFYIAVDREKWRGIRKAENFKAWCFVLDHEL